MSRPLAQWLGLSLRTALSGLTGESARPTGSGREPENGVASILEGEEHGVSPTAGIETSVLKPDLLVRLQRPEIADLHRQADPWMPFLSGKVEQGTQKSRPKSLTHVLWKDGDGHLRMLLRDEAVSGGFLRESPQPCCADRSSG